jgi:hypothetical protein
MLYDLSSCDNRQVAARDSKIRGFGAVEEDGKEEEEEL